MAIYPNDSTTFSVWLATVSSANFSSQGFIACSRQVICPINNTAARESSQNPGYKWFHTLLFTTMPARDALLGKHGAQGLHLESPLPRQGVLILTLSCGSGTGIAWVGGRTTCTLVHTCAYLHTWSPVPTCPQKLQLLPTPAWPTPYLHPLLCCDKIKQCWHLLCVKQDWHINYHLWAGLTYLLLPLQLAMGSTNICTFLGDTIQFFWTSHLWSQFSSSEKIHHFSRFVKKLTPLVLQLVPLVLLGVNYSGLLVWN